VKMMVEASGKLSGKSTGAGARSSGSGGGATSGGKKDK